MTVPLAPGCRLEPTPDLRSIDGGRILIGGAPLRILRLHAEGAALVTAWFGGQEIGDRAAHQQLARRLERNGMAHVRWPANGTGSGSPIGPGATGPTVIIPSHDDVDEVARTLGAGLAEWAGEIIVVDDGSDQPIGSLGPGVTVIRRDAAGGPGQARQTGLEATTAALVVFVDAGVVLDADTAAGLVRAFVDPAVVAAAPRVRSEPGEGPVASYEVRRSPLDLGPIESLVGPGRPIPYVPTACLAVRTEAVTRVGGFDPGLRFGEDVDLVWRLGRVGSVRYLPGLTALHRPRRSVPAMLSQRADYGSSAARLAARHGPDDLVACRVSPWTALVVTLTLAGRPILAATTAFGTGLALAPKLRPMPDARVEALVLTARGHRYGALSILTAVTRAWAPLLVPAVVAGSRPRRVAGALLAAGAGRRLLDGPRQPGPAVLDTTLGLADDLAYCAGLWRGALSERTTAPLRVDLASWPGGPSTLRSRVTAAVARFRRANADQAP